MSDQVLPILWAIARLLVVLNAIGLIVVVLSLRRNHYLKSIDQMIKAHPDIQFQRRLEAVEKRAAR